MIKFFTKVILLVLATTIISSGFNVTTSASELKTQNLNTINIENVVNSETPNNIGVNETGPGENLIVPYGVSKPTSIWNLAKKGRYFFSGTNNSAGSLYTNYLFTGKSTFKISVKNTDHQVGTKFKVKKKGKIFDKQIGKTYVVKQGKSGQITIKKLDKSSKYYIEFVGPTKFNGSIE